MQDYLVILAGYALLGGGIKYIDEAYDENTFSKRSAGIAAFLCVVVMGYLIVNDGPSMMIFLGMIIALIFAKKIDNPAFTMGVAGVIPLPILFNSSLNIEIVPLAVLIITGIMDERGNDLADSKKIKGFLKKFFKFRCMMKVGVLGLCIFGFFGFIYFAAFMMFDIFYYLVKIYSSNIAYLNKNSMNISPIRYMLSLIKI